MNNELNDIKIILSQYQDKIKNDEIRQWKNLQIN